MHKNTLTLLLILQLVLLSTTTFAVILNDNGQISSTEVTEIIQVKSEADILNALRQANKKQLPIAIMGKQHSQGGQSLAPQAIELNMLQFNKVLGFDADKKQVTVQSGITWGDLQKFINPYNVAIKSMQSPNIFTVGGSISVNAHGDDFRAGSVSNSLVAFELLLANGHAVQVSQSQTPELWSAVVGGYGLFGVITKVTLQLTDNDLLRSYYQEMTFNDFPGFFNNYILHNKDRVLFYAHMNTVPGSDFLDKLYVISYQDLHQIPSGVITLDNPDKWNSVLTPIFDMSRHSLLGKLWRWKMERNVFRKIYSNHVVTRNNGMEKPVRFASDHFSEDNVDWLQEYFIPLSRLPEFIKSLKGIMNNNQVDLLNLTIRYVPAEPDILLSYTQQDCFAVVLYFNQNLAKSELEKTKTWTRQLIDAALVLEGNYYLPYQYFATLEQFHKAYPKYQEFLKIKDKFDPEHRFSNQFYKHYL